MGGRVAVNINTQKVPYEYREYPRILHKPGGAEKRVENDAEKEAELANGWELMPSPVVVPDVVNDEPAPHAHAPAAKGKKAKD